MCHLSVGRPTNLLPGIWPMRIFIPLSTYMHPLHCRAMAAPFPRLLFHRVSHSSSTFDNLSARAVLQRVHGARQHLPLPRGARQGHRKDPTGNKLTKERTNPRRRRRPRGKDGRMEGRPYRAGERDRLLTWVTVNASCIEQPLKSQAVLRRCRMSPYIHT